MQGIEALISPVRFLTKAAVSPTRETTRVSSTIRRHHQESDEYWLREIGRSGCLGTDIVNKNPLLSCFLATNPKAIMTHLRAGGIWGDVASAAVVSALSKLVD